MSYINTETLEYPISEREVIARAFPPNTTPARPFVAPTPYAWVFPAPQPEYDPITQGVRLADPVYNEGKDIWELPWEVYDLDPEDAAANLAQAVEQARAAAHRRINGEYTARTAQLVEGYPENEQKSWPMQVLEAQAILDDPQAPAIWIRSAASARGITPLDLAGLIQAQDSGYRALHGSYSGTRQALRDQIDAVEVSEEAVAILNSIQWP